MRSPLALFACVYVAFLPLIDCATPQAARKKQNSSKLHGWLSLEVTSTGGFKTQPNEVEESDSERHDIDHARAATPRSQEMEPRANKSSFKLLHESVVPELHVNWLQVENKIGGPLEMVSPTVVPLADQSTTYANIGSTIPSIPVAVTTGIPLPPLNIVVSQAATPAVATQRPTIYQDAWHTNAPMMPYTAESTTMPETKSTSLSATGTSIPMLERYVLDTPASANATPHVVMRSSSGEGGPNSRGEADSCWTWLLISSLSFVTICLICCAWPEGISRAMMWCTRRRARFSNSTADNSHDNEIRRPSRKPPAWVLPPHPASGSEGEKVGRSMTEPRYQLRRGDSGIKPTYGKRRRSRERTHFQSQGSTVGHTESEAVGNTNSVMGHTRAMRHAESEFVGNTNSVVGHTRSMRNTDSERPVGPEPSSF